MIIHFTLNGAPQELTVNPGENVQKLLFNMGSLQESWHRFVPAKYSDRC